MPKLAGRVLCIWYAVPSHALPHSGLYSIPVSACVLHDVTPMHKFTEPLSVPLCGSEREAHVCACVCAHRLLCS